MNPKVLEKEKAIALRHKGLSYKDILGKLTVSKSSLSLWLKDLPLTEDEKRYLKSRQDANISRGRIRAASSFRQNRLEREKVILSEAREEFTKYTHNPLFHVGIALYWAEGSKRTNSFAFTNSDEDMICTMLEWIHSFFGLKKEDIGVRLYSHKPFAAERQEEYWAKKTGIPLSNFRKTVYKKSESLSKKRPGYKGCLRIQLGRTVHFKKIQFWQQMLIECYRKQG